MLGKVLITAKSFLITPEPMKILQEAGCEAEYRAGVFPVNEDRLIEQVRYDRILIVFQGFFHFTCLIIALRHLCNQF